MTYAIIVGAALLLLIGAAFFWLNLNSPIQTRIPAFMLPVGAVLMVVGLTLALFACSTPAVKDRVVEIDKPVAVRPIQVADVPTPPTPLPPRPAQLSAAADLLLSKWCAAVSYMLKADPLLRVSAGMPQKALEQYPECEGR